MKSTLSKRIHNYTPLLADMQRGLDEDCKPNKVGSRKEKYALRERQKRRLGLASVVEMPKRSNHKDDNEATAGPRRTQNQTASKSKAPPLSKYRRKTANARERTRMREINSAFENLRHCVPQSIAVDQTGPTSEKLTKITTLRLAMKYISLLSDALNNPNFNGELPMDFLYDSDDIQITEVVSPAQQPSKCETKKKSSTAKKPTNKTITDRTKCAVVSQKPAKRLGKRKKKAPNTLTAVSKSTSESCYTTSNASNSSSFIACSGDSLSSHSSSFLDSITSPSYSNPFVPSMYELNSLALESDGESLHLSDPCNSPLQDHFDNLLLGAGNLDHKPLVGHGILGEIDTPLELSLQLLGATPQPLEFSMEHPPTTCISPLSALDTYNPFSDFLQEYPGPASLDLFLT